MSDTTAIGDPLRQQVEATLRRLLDDVVGVPCQVVRVARDRVAQPVAVARSLVSLTVGGLLGRGLHGGDRPSPAWEAPPVRSSVTRVPDGPTDAPDPTRLPASELPIEDYESLAASQVVSRLERLDAAELRRVETFETAHRGRRTVLGKIEQLLTHAGR